MKTVTRDRIMAALAKTYAYRDAEMKELDQMVAQFMMLGMKQAAAGATSTDSDKVSLELDYLGIPKDPMVVQQRMDRYMYLRELECRHRDRVYAIARQHQIGGLIPCTLVIHDATLEHLQDEDEGCLGLPLIPEDVPICQAEKVRVVAFVLHCLQHDPALSHYKIWRSREGEYNLEWTETDVATVMAIAPDYDYAKCSVDERQGRMEISLSLYHLKDGLDYDRAEVGCEWLIFSPAQPQW
jgi:hypothetical protein